MTDNEKYESIDNKDCGVISTLPVKPQINEVHYDEKIDWSKVCSMFSTPTVALIFIQGVPGCLPWGMNRWYLFLHISHYLSWLEQRQIITVFDDYLNISFSVQLVSHQFIFRNFPYFLVCQLLNLIYKYRSGMIYVFLNDYFSQDRGMSVETATGALVVFGVGGFLGQAIGKFLI